MMNNKLKQQRIAAGMEQSDLSERTGIPIYCIQQYEIMHGYATMPRENALAIANALSCKPENFVPSCIVCGKIVERRWQFCSKKCYEENSKNRISKINLERWENWKMCMVCGRTFQSSNKQVSCPEKCGYQIRDQRSDKKYKAVKHWVLQSPAGDIHQVYNLSTFESDIDTNMVFSKIANSMLGDEHPPIFTWKGWKLLDWRKPGDFPSSKSTGVTIVDIHPFVIRSYEERRLLISPKKQSEEHHFSPELYIEQIKLIHLAFHVEIPDDTYHEKVEAILRASAVGDFDRAIQEAQEYLDMTIAYKDPISYMEHVKRNGILIIKKLEEMKQL
jgi:predicted nucleic acid-binding Zn ribbon protein